MSKINESQYPERASSWICDSGCTAHMTFDKSLFDTYENVSDASVEMGTKATTKVVGCGSITLNMQYGSSYRLRKLENVLHIPSFEYSLLSVSAMDKKGMKATFGDAKCVIHKGSFTVADGSLEGSLYVMQTQSLPLEKSKALVSSLQRWHERMAHVDKRGIAQMAARGVVHGLTLHDHDTSLVCDGCAKGKAHRSDIPKERSSQRALNLLDRVHSDVCGPVEVRSLGGSRYLVTFIDEHSNWVTVYLMKQKSEVVECFLQYEKYAERQTGRKIRVIRSDRGGEYLSDSLTSYFRHQGIVHELTAGYTPHQNGIAERFNRTSFNLVRSMMQHMNVPKCFWAEALSTAVYVRNRVTSRALPSNTTPFHVWKKDTPSIGHLRIFGCKCCYTVPKVKVQKLDARGRPAIFVGYAENSKAYKLIDLENGKVVVSRDVTFEEDSPANLDFNSEESEFDFLETMNRTDSDQLVSIEAAMDTSGDENSNFQHKSVDAETEVEEFKHDDVSSPNDDDQNVQPPIDASLLSDLPEAAYDFLFHSFLCSNPPLYGPL